MRTFMGGVFAAMAIRGAVLSARPLSTTDDLLVALSVAMFGGFAAVCLIRRDKPPAGER